MIALAKVIKTIEHFDCHIRNRLQKKTQTTHPTGNSAFSTKKFQSMIFFRELFQF